MCLEELKHYAFNEESIMLIKQWLQSEGMCVKFEGKPISFQLQFREKISLMKLVQSSYFASNTEKEEICAKVYILIAKGQVFNDLTSLCQWSLPDPDLKEKLWREMIDPTNNDS